MKVMARNNINKYKLYYKKFYDSDKEHTTSKKMCCLPAIFVNLFCENQVWSLIWYKLNLIISINVIGCK